MPRITWLLLLAGVAIRLVTISQPIVDAMTLRQTQTADAIRSLLEEPGLALDSRTSWRGDLGGRVVLELPLYNLSVAVLSSILRTLSSDLSSTSSSHFPASIVSISGKLVSIMLWSLSFFLLQGLWRHCLPDPDKQLWANLLFIFCPLEVFFGQAVMPEMLTQVLAFGLVLTAIRFSFQKRCTLVSFLPVWFCGTLSALVKLPSVSHLAVLVLVLLLLHQGWGGLRHYWLWIGVIMTMLLLKLWSAYADQVNLSNHFENWAPSETIWGFLGSWQNRLNPHLYFKISAYTAVFILSPLGVPLLLGGAVWLIKNRKTEWKNPMVLWIASLIFFYGIWGTQTAAHHSYYNLPAVAPACFLFALGMNQWKSWIQVKYRLPIMSMTCALVLLGTTAGTVYLFQQDRILYHTALWAKDHTPSGTIILFRPNHRDDMIDYQHNPVFSYYSERSTFIWAGATPVWEKERALEKSDWIIVTHRPPTTSALTGFVSRIKKSKRRNDNLKWLHELKSFTVFYENKEFSVYRKVSL